MKWLHLLRIRGIRVIRGLFLISLFMSIPNGALPDDLDLLTAVLGKPVVWAYGKHVVGGNVVLIDDSAADHRVIFVTLGEGEWDGVESVYVNGEQFFDRTGLADASGFLFHPGKAGVVGTAGETGDQKVSRWFPAGVTQLNFSHTAYVALWVAKDFSAPGPDLDIRGIYRTRKLQEYDSAGTPTLYQYSANPAWEVLDLLLSFYKLATSRIDFASFVTAAADCNVQVSAANRFEGHVFFTDESGDQALDRLLATCRGFLTDYDGKISLRVDQVRTSQHDLTMDNIVEGTFKYELSDTSKRPNRIVSKFRDTANNYAFVEKQVDREAHQTKVGRITRADLDLGNTTYGRAFRIANYLLARSVDLPEMVRLRGMIDSFHLMPGDVVRVKHDAAPWPYAGGTPDFKDFEVLEATDNFDDTRDFLLQEYAATSYSDSEETAQALDSLTIGLREGVAANVTAQSIVENAGFARDGHAVSKITASFTAPNPRKNWGGVNIYAVGYRGGTKPLLVAAGNDGPLIFDLESTNETVTFYFVSFSADGRERAILTSPSASVLLDGQDTGPAAPSGFTGQTGAQLGQVVRLTWTENAEVDIDHYEIAKLAQVAGACPAAIPGPADTDVIATVAAAGIAAGRKAQWDDAPGSSDGTKCYYVRAVNATLLKSGWAGPATITSVAPDGTTDIAVPTATGVAPGDSGNVEGGVTGGITWGLAPPTAKTDAGSLVVESTGFASFSGLTNWAGVIEIEWQVESWADINATSEQLIRKHPSAFDPLKASRFILEAQNRYIKSLDYRVKNYFGWSALQNVVGWAPGALAFMGSQSQDSKPPAANFDAAVQDYGARKVIGRSTGDLVLDTNSASAKVNPVKPLNLTGNPALQVGGVTQGDAASGYLLAYLGANGKKLAVGGASFVNGVATVATGLSTVDQFLMALVTSGAAPANEDIGHDAAVGGSVTCRSNLGTSNSTFSWLAVGT